MVIVDSLGKIASRILLQITVQEELVRTKDILQDSKYRSILKLGYVLSLFIAYIAVFPLVIFVLELSKIGRFKKVVFAILPASNEVGHIIMDYALVRSQADGRLIIYAFKGRRGGNKWWLSLIEREEIVIPCWIVRPIYFWGRTISCLNDRVIAMPSQISRSRDLGGLLEKNKFQIEYHVHEEQLFRTFAEKYRITNKGFVCLIVRDSAYKGNDKSQELQEYRNSTLDNYQRGVEWLSGQGIVVLRMGKNCRNKLPFSGPNIVDYATSEDRSDLLDIMLFSRCRFAISTGTGIDFVCSVFRRPVLFIDFIPISAVHSFDKSMHIPKVIRRASDRGLVTFQELIDMPSLQRFCNLTLMQREYVAEESNEWVVLKGIINMLESLDRSDYCDSFNDRCLTLYYLSRLRESSDYIKYHGYVDPGFRISSAWGVDKCNEFFGEEILREN